MLELVAVLVLITFVAHERWYMVKTCRDRAMLRAQGSVSILDHNISQWSKICKEKIERLQNIPSAKYLFFRFDLWSSKKVNSYLKTLTN